MTAVLQPSESPPPGQAPDHRPTTRRMGWNRFTPLQLVVLGLATIPPLVVLGTIAAGLVGLVSLETVLTVALAAGENPGMMIFGAMFLATPMQWLTGRSQVRVRKYLGIVFYLLALSNGALFVVERGLESVFSSPFVIAGTIALGLATPLAATSSRWSQRAMGMRRWRLLHKLTYVIAGALLGHVILMADVGPGAVMIALGFVARIPAVKRWMVARGR